MCCHLKGMSGRESESLDDDRVSSCCDGLLVAATFAVLDGVVTSSSDAFLFFADDGPDS